MTEKENQIKNLLDYNLRKLREISFNTCKVRCLEIDSIASEDLAKRYIENHVEQYKDEDEKELLQAFFNKYSITK